MANADMLFSASSGRKLFVYTKPPDAAQQCPTESQIVGFSGVTQGVCVLILSREALLKSARTAVRP